MTDDELKQFADLAKKYERGKDKEKVKSIISSDIHEVFQDINDGGHSAATKAKQGEIDRLEQEKKAEKERADAAEQKLTGIDEKSPDLAKLRKTYEENEARIRQEYDDKLRNKDTEHQQALQKKDEDLLNSQLTIAKSKLIDKLSADTKNGIEKEYAETVLIEKPEVKGRLKVVNGEVRVLQKGSQDMFITPAEGKTALDHFAEEIAETVDPRWKVSGGGRGSASRGSEGGSSGSALESRFEETRKRVKEQEESARKQKENGSGLERLGNRR